MEEDDYINDLFDREQRLRDAISESEDIQIEQEMSNNFNSIHSENIKMSNTHPTRLTRSIYPCKDRQSITGDVQRQDS
jgi:hypothetical protein